MTYPYLKNICIMLNILQFKIKVGNLQNSNYPKNYILYKVSLIKFIDVNSQNYLDISI